MEFLVEMRTEVPAETSAETVAETRAREAVRAQELIAEGHIVRLWKPPEARGEWRTFGLFDAADETELRRVLESMPLHVWMTFTVTPLRPHPSDPGRY
jgi:muconolactone delta-isomerase